MRLSPRFSLPFLVTAAGWLLFGFPWALARTLPAVEAYRPRILPGLWEAAHGPTLAAALLTLLLAAAGLLAALWAATAVYRLLPPRVVIWHRPTAVAPTAPPSPAAGALGAYDRIGIVLAGGGAKGAYQAGALVAIHRFLADHGALGSVKMIAGTSIGAWNACFWLADRLDGEDGLCERWWSEVRLSEVVAPTFYLPTRRNYVLSADPWRRAFRSLFAEDPASRDRLLSQLTRPDAPENVRFYLTRTNLERAHLEFSTNRAELVDIENSSGRRRPLVPADRWTRASSLDDLEQAVFASMDLPPLFENIQIGDEVFEDGGVVDNLPIYFGTGIEKCDLLFVLPLNASFTASASAGSGSVLKRIERVMAIRQGALERQALKDVYLYNELAVLRDRLAAPRPAESEDSAAPSGSAPALAEAAGHSLDDRAARRVHRPVQIFAVCPDEPLLLDTVEFWKTDAAGRAFRLMREYTRYELDSFDFSAAPNWIRVALIGSEGEVRYLEDF